jgi:hypothetical protein
MYYCTNNFIILAVPFICYEHLVAFILHIKNSFVLLWVGPDFMIFSEFLVVNWDMGSKVCNLLALKSW